MGRNDLFDLPRPDLVAAGLDQFLLAVDDVEVAFLVRAGNIAGVQPAIPQSILRLGGHVVITLHNIGAFYDQFADLTGRQHRHLVFQADDAAIHIRQRQPDRTGWVLAKQGVAVCGCRRFRQAIALDQLAARQGFELLLGLQHQRGRARDAGLDRTEIVFACQHFRMVVDGVVHGRHARIEGSLVFLQAVEHILHIARVRDHDHRSRLGDGVAHPSHHAIDVEQRDCH